MFHIEGCHQQIQYHAKCWGGACDLKMQDSFESWLLRIVICTSPDWSPGVLEGTP